MVDKGFKNDSDGGKLATGLPTDYVDSKGKYHRALLNGAYSLVAVCKGTTGGAKKRAEVLMKLCRWLRAYEIQSIHDPRVGDDVRFAFRILSADYAVVAELSSLQVDEVHELVVSEDRAKLGDEEYKESIALDRSFYSH
jgi:hypothetical protein